MTDCWRTLTWTASSQTWLTQACQSPMSVHCQENCHIECLLWLMLSSGDRSVALSRCHWQLNISAQLSSWELQLSNYCERTIKAHCIRCSNMQREDCSTAALQHCTHLTLWVLISDECGEERQLMISRYRITFPGKPCVTQNWAWVQKWLKATWYVIS